METYVAFLRGINVGGHHKVPMKELKAEMESWGYADVVTLLNSGNIIFRSERKEIGELEPLLQKQIENHFGFPIPTRIRTGDQIGSYLELNPFKNIEATKDTRLYVSFLSHLPEDPVGLPWISEDGSFRIISNQNHDIFSVLDLSKRNTPKGMEKLEKFYGKDITTRNWNTLVRIAGKI